MNLSSETIGKVTAALIDAQNEFAPAVKDSTNPAFRSKYVSLDGVLDAVGPALRNHRIALVQQPYVDGELTVLSTRLIHESGEWLGSHYPVRPVKHDPQGEGSALTYARRYSVMAICGIAPEDDDGNAASQEPAPRPAAARRASAPKTSGQPASDQSSPFALEFESPEKYQRMILEAGDQQTLNSAGGAIAAAALEGTDRDTLRALFSTRMAELKEAE